MTRRPKLVILLKNGTRLDYKINDYEDFYSVVKRVYGFFSNWILVCGKSFIKKSSIDSIHFLPVLDEEMLEVKNEFIG